MRKTQAIIIMAEMLMAIPTLACRNDPGAPDRERFLQREPKRIPVKPPAGMPAGG